MGSQKKTKTATSNNNSKKIKMLKFFILMAAIALASGQYRKLEWSLCGQGVLDIQKLEATPMPIRHPGELVLALTASNRREIKGAVKSKVTINRAVSGLSLAIRCYLVDGNQVGSCTYDDLCGLLNGVLSLTPDNCPQNLIDNGINCKCPFDVPERDLEIDTNFQLPDADSTPISWIGTGDFEAKIDASDSKGKVICLEL